MLDFQFGGFIGAHSAEISRTRSSRIHSGGTPPNIVDFQAEDGFHVLISRHAGEETKALVKPFAMILI